MTFHDFAPQDYTDDTRPKDIVPPDPAVPADAVPPAYSIRPRLRTILLSFLVHHNPFYLISALCMIAGCYILNAGLELRSGEIHRILLLIGTLSVYELMLVGLGLFLIRGRGILRDGRTLLLLQLVFLVDLTFLNAETVTADLRLGLLINGALLLLALLKLGAVLKWLSPRFPWRSFAMAGLMLSALFALPCVLRAIEVDGRIAGEHFHAIWWCVGLLPVACEAIRQTRRRAGDEVAATMRPRLSGLYVSMGYVSVVAHLLLMHWVYQGRFFAADLTPVLLGLAVAAAYNSPSRVITGGDLRFARLWLPLAAVLCAIAGPRPMDFAIGLGGRVELHSVHLALAGAFAVYVYAYFWTWIRSIALVSAAVAGLLLFGPTFRQIAAMLSAGWDQTLAAGAQIMPKTMLQWGMTAVGAAFAFLGLGALLSLSQPKQPPPEEASKPAG